jgi:hypothetical protein
LTVQNAAALKNTGANHHDDGVEHAMAKSRVEIVSIAKMATARRGWEESASWRVTGASTGTAEANSASADRPRQQASRLLPHDLPQRFINPLLPARPIVLEMIEHVPIYAQRDKLFGVRE